jgi:hypothetical protein
VLEKCLTADMAYHTEKLAEAIESATLRSYHGCRTTDAGIYSRASRARTGRCSRSSHAIRSQGVPPSTAYCSERLALAPSSARSRLPHSRRR